MATNDCGFPSLQRKGNREGKEWFPTRLHLVDTALGFTATPLPTTLAIAPIYGKQTKGSDVVMVRREGAESSNFCWKT